MTANLQLALSLFVEHGREREAARFYAAAFGATEGAQHHLDDGTLIDTEMKFGGTTIYVCGSNPAREQEPARGGPFFPKASGAVSAIFQLTVDDLEKTVGRALAEGGMLRDDVQDDIFGRRVASVFDPFGHIWALIERSEASLLVAA